MNIEQVQNELEMLYDTLPDIIFSELNGGILLRPEAKTDPRAGGKYYILGEYCTDGVMGRYIKIYHGSFEAVLGEAKEDMWTRSSGMGNVKHPSSSAFNLPNYFLS